MIHNLGFIALAIWRAWTGDVRGHALDRGPSLPEVEPQETSLELRDLFRDERER
jgi:hypothetical protein